LHNFTIEEKAAAGDHFLRWLKKKYPVTTELTLLSEYLPIPYIKEKGVSAHLMRSNDTLWKMQIAANGDLYRVLKSVAHEYAHVKQIFIDKIPYKKLNRSHEVEAWGFSTKELDLYIEHMEARSVEESAS
jgi:hypothetical protein